MAVLSKKNIKTLVEIQKNEITEHYIYKKLAAKTKNEENKKILSKIADDEKRHYEFWKKHSEKEIRPSGFKLFTAYWTAKILGLTFALKQMENGEKSAWKNYDELSKEIPSASQIAKDEREHEKSLINLLEEEKLQYVGSIVLGLNDALVELTGALAGLTLALPSVRLVALAGLITGIAASFSMAASEYLSTKAEDENAPALKSAIYTGSAYIITVMLLILPYLLLENPLICLAITISVAVLIIFSFNYYISVAKDLPFKKRFLEMAAISLGVSAFTFLIGFVVNKFLGIEA